MHNNGSNKPLRNRNPKIMLQKVVFKENFFTRLRDFQHFPGPALILQDFPVLENAK